MAFPCDFGFVPSTRADDSDPVDVLVLMDEPVFAGCVLSCRLIGVIEGEQGDKKKKVRNDRLVAVEQDAHISPAALRLVSAPSGSRWSPRPKTPHPLLWAGSLSSGSGRTAVAAAHLLHKLPMVTRHDQCCVVGCVRDKG